MTEEGGLGVRRSPEIEDETEVAKADLQRRMDEARESIAQTVTEIKDNVTDQYQTVKDTVADTLSWREQFRKHPVEWSAGALVVGFLIGRRLGASLGEVEAFARLQEQIDAAGESLSDKFADIGDALAEQFSALDQYIVPALVGAATPVLAAQMKELLGIDLSGIFVGDSAGGGKGKKRSGKGKKKGGGGKKKKKSKLKADAADAS